MAKYFVTWFFHKSFLQILMPFCSLFSMLKDIIPSKRDGDISQQRDTVSDVQYPISYYVYDVRDPRARQHTHTRTHICIH